MDAGDDRTAECSRTRITLGIHRELAYTEKQRIKLFPHIRADLVTDLAAVLPRSGYTCRHGVAMVEVEQRHHRVGQAQARVEAIGSRVRAGAAEAQIEAHSDQACRMLRSLQVARNPVTVSY